MNLCVVYIGNGNVGLSVCRFNKSHCMLVRGLIAFDRSESHAVAGELSKQV